MQLILFLLMMPPNPFADAKKPVIEPKWPVLMNTGIKRVDPAIGERKALVILIDFTDNQSAYLSSDFDSLIYGTNKSSLRDYYSEVSFGRFTIDTASTITDWVRAPNNYSYYIGARFGIYPGNYPNNVQGIVVAACNLADPMVNFADYDNDIDGIVDEIFIVTAVPGA